MQEAARQRGFWGFGFLGFWVFGFGVWVLGFREGFEGEVYDLGFRVFVENTPSMPGRARCRLQVP